MVGFITRKQAMGRLRQLTSDLTPELWPDNSTNFMRLLLVSYLDIATHFAPSSQRIQFPLEPEPQSSSDLEWHYSKLQTLYICLECP
jgi:hypothetical protein